VLALAVEPFGRLEVADERALGEWQSDPATASTFGALHPHSPCVMLVRAACRHSEAN
jgi:hypothetical protein